jgi:hypothetical protein
MSRARRLLPGWLLVLCVIPAALVAAETVAREAALATAGAGLVRDATTEIRLSAAAATGEVWAIGMSRGRPAALRWEEDRWNSIHSWERWPGRILDLVADPSRPGDLVSLWRGDAENPSAEVLQLWRHSPAAGATRLALFAHPGASEARRRVMPRLAVGPEGDAWLSFAEPLLLRVPAAGGEPSSIEVPPEALAASGARQTREALPLAFLPNGAGAGWLWSVYDEKTRGERGALRRPWRVAGGKAWLPDAPQGLPDEARVVALWRGEASGETIWSVENSGLWSVDAEGARAVPLASPSEAWCVLDWRRWPGGREVALVFSNLPREDRLAGEIWVKLNGAWRNHGPSGDLGASILVAEGRAMAPRDWVASRDLLLGAGFDAGLVMVDLGVAERRARVLGWRERQEVARPRRLFEIGRGRILLQGEITVAMPFAWPRAEAWRADDLEAEGVAPRVWAFAERPTRTEDGRLWYLRTSGEGAPSVHHWDGERWQVWPAPAGAVLSVDSLWVDALGRATLWQGSLAKQAWVRDEAAPEGWRVWSSATALIQARAAEGPKADILVPKGETTRAGPVFSADGRALLGHFSRLHYFDGGSWRSFRSADLAGGFSHYGFLAASGAPFVYSPGRLRRLEENGQWVRDDEHPESLALRRAQEQARQSHGTDWQRALEGRVENLGGVTAAHPDAGGDWWFVENRELRRLHRGEVVNAFPSDAASPFRPGRGGSFQEVLVDSRGHRLFVGAPHVFLPALPGPEIGLRASLVGEGPDIEVEAPGPGAARAEWRVGETAWRRIGSASWIWPEPAPGLHRFEARALGPRLDPGPVAAVEVRVDYDREARIAELANAVRDPSRRVDAVRRLARHGAAAEAGLRAAIAAEPDDDRRWWLRAALQAVKDARGVEAAP